MAKKDPLSRVIRRVVLPVAKGPDGERVTRTKQELLLVEGLGVLPFLC